MEIMTCFAKANLKAKEQVLSELMQDFSSSSVDIRHDDISAATLKWMILCNRNDTVYLREKSFAEVIASPGGSCSKKRRSSSSSPVGNSGGGSMTLRSADNSPAANSEGVAGTDPQDADSAPSPKS